MRQGRFVADEKLGQQIERRGGRGKTDAAKLSAVAGITRDVASCSNRFERERQVGAALVAGEGMQFIDDDELRNSQDAPRNFPAPASRRDFPAW